MDGTGSGSCSLARFCTGGVANSCYATRKLVNKKTFASFHVSATV
jgi:hypothetical protein